MSRTRSVWGQPRTYFYRLLHRIERIGEEQGPLQVAVLGCADGKYVLPAARRGHSVLAIDTEALWLFGGVSGTGNIHKEVLGLRKRLEVENLAHLVSIQHVDFIDFQPALKYDLVFLSGSVHYPCNTQRRRQEIFDGIKKYARLGGFVFADFMLPRSPIQESRANFPNMSDWKNTFSVHGWQVVYSRKMCPFIEEPHIDVPYPHEHQKGYILAQRIG